MRAINVPPTTSLRCETDRHVRCDQDRSHREGRQLDRPQISSLLWSRPASISALTMTRGRRRSQIADARSRKRREDEAVFAPRTPREKRVQAQSDFRHRLAQSHSPAMALILRERIRRFRFRWGAVFSLDRRATTIPR